MENMSKMEEWYEFWEENPRKSIPTQLKEFVEFAKKNYRQVCTDMGRKEFVVNMTHIGEDEVDEEVEHQIGESAEILLLYRGYLGKKGGKE